jgi:hypothetical protein
MKPPVLIMGLHLSDMVAVGFRSVRVVLILIGLGEKIILRAVSIIFSFVGQNCLNSSANKNDTRGVTKSLDSQ